MDRILLPDIIGGLACVAAAGSLGLYAKGVWKYMGHVERLCVGSLATLFTLIGTRIAFELTVLDTICVVLMIPCILIFLVTMRRVSNQQQQLRAELQNLKDYIASLPGPGAMPTNPNVLKETTDRICRVIKSAG